MKSIKQVLLYGFFIWLIPFAVAVLIFPIRENDRPLFESIMPVAVAVSVVVFTVLYARKYGPVNVRTGVMLGILWFLISLVIDLFMFSAGPMKMGFVDYMKDIGITYLIMPAITIGAGYLSTVHS